MLHSTGRRAPRKQAADQRLIHYSHAIAPAAGSGALERALLAALRLRRPQVLGRLAEQVGAAAFAQALAGLSARKMVDALSLLPDDQRGAVCARLPAQARRRWHAAAASRAEGDQPAQSPNTAARPAARSRLLPRPAQWAWPWRARGTAGAAAATAPASA